MAVGRYAIRIVLLSRTSVASACDYGSGCNDNWLITPKLTESQTCSFSHTVMKLNTPLPQPLPKECAKAAKICTSSRLAMESTADFFCLAVKSFVDSGNNGLDGVRHPLVIPSVERQLEQTLGYPEGGTSECERLRHFHHLQGGFLVLCSRWVWRCDCEARGWM